MSIRTAMRIVPGALIESASSAFLASDSAWYAASRRLGLSNCKGEGCASRSAVAVVDVEGALVGCEADSGWTKQHN